MRSWALILLAAFIGGCGPGRPAPNERALIWARSADSGTLDPAAIEWGEDAKITENIFETLVAFRDASGQFEGRLAKSWTFSPDRKTLTFELREGVRFHDGTTFDAGDVVFTFGRLLDADHPGKPKVVPYKPNFEVIASVKADGPARVVFALKQPSAVILHLLSLFGAAIVSPEAVKKYGAEWPVNPVGTGPYRLARWERQVKIVLERFDGYWGPRPAIDRVIVIPVQSPQTALQKLKMGEVHVVDHPTLADVASIRSDPNLKVEFEAPVNVCYLGFNLNAFPYSDINFRRAVSLALDRAVLNNLVYYRQAEPASNIVPPAFWRAPAPTPYEHDIGKAKEFLAKVNLGPAPIELIHPTFGRAYMPEPQKVAEWVKDQLRKIGIEIKLTGYDSSAVYGPRTKEKDHPMYLLGWNADYLDPDNFFYPLLHGDNAGDLNGSFFKDARFDDVVKKAQSETDPATRQGLYLTAFERYRELLPTLPLVHAKQVIALSKKVRYKMHPTEVRFYEASFAE